MEGGLVNGGKKRGRGNGGGREVSRKKVQEVRKAIE